MILILVFFYISSSDFNNVEYVSNYDGDTIFFNIPNLNDIFAKRMSVRLTGVDTAEIKTKKECEKKIALEAKNTVKVLLSKAKQISLKDCFKDKYFRLNCKIFFDKKDLGLFLLEKKLAVSYDGKKKKDHKWCN